MDVMIRVALGYCERRLGMVKEVGIIQYMKGKEDY
jgi:hypothetical protein